VSRPGLRLLASARALSLLSAVALLSAPATASAAEPESTFYVRALGDLSPTHGRFACQVITEVFSVRCRVLRARPLAQATFDAGRNQHDADRLVRDLFGQLPDDGIGLMALTNADLFEPGQSSFVFGLASLVDHVGVVSLARYRTTWWGQPEDRVKFYERFYRVLVHEVGHTLGVGHCERAHCGMRRDRTLADLDGSPPTFCDRCQQSVARGLKQGPGTLMWHYTRGHSHLSRGQFARAVYHLQRAAELDPGDPRVVNDLGVAYLRRGDQGRALWHFRAAKQLDPAFPNPRYNEGLVFLGVGDTATAALAFEQALGADPGWALAHRQLGYLYQEALGDEETALEHFQAYLEHNGDDSLVQDRVRLIKGGGPDRLPR
jgi:archaemetzincin